MNKVRKEMRSRHKKSKTSIKSRSKIYIKNVFENYPKKENILIVKKLNEDLFLKTILILNNT